MQNSLGSVFSTTERYIGHVERWAVGVASVLVFLMLVTVTYSSIARYLFSAPLGWVHEFTGFLLICVNALPLAAALRGGQHLAIDVVFIRLPPALRSKALTVSALLALVVVSLFAWGTTAAAVDSILVWDVGPLPYQLPVYPVKSVMAVALLLFGVENFLLLVRTVRGDCRPLST